jgi:hypothetical protein
MRFPCPNCKNSLEARVDQAGNQIACPVCQRRLLVPGSVRCASPAPVSSPATPAERPAAEPASRPAPAAADGQGQPPRPKRQPKAPARQAAPSAPAPPAPAAAPATPSPVEEASYRGRLLVLAYGVSLGLLLYGGVSYSLSYWLMGSLAAATAVAAVPLVLLVWPRPFDWLAALVHMVYDATLAGRANWEELQRVRTRARWERETKAQLEAQERARLVEEVNRWRADGQAQVGAEIEALRTRLTAEVNADGERRAAKLKQRLRDEEEGWRVRKQRAVDEAVAQAQRDTDAAVRNELRQWQEAENRRHETALHQWHADALQRCQAEIEQWRTAEQDRCEQDLRAVEEQRRKEVADQLVAWHEQERARLAEELRNAPEFQVGQEWLDVADRECPSCLSKIGRPKVAYVCGCGACYCDVCFEETVSKGREGELCNAKASNKHSRTPAAFRQVQQFQPPTDSVRRKKAGKPRPRVTLTAPSAVPGTPPPRRRVKLS